MNTTPATPLDIDRVALSHELLALAERFELEATLWRDRDCRAQLQHNANLLATIGRAVLTDADYDKALAFADVATTAVRNIEGTRRFLHVVATPPRVGRREP